MPIDSLPYCLYDPDTGSVERNPAKMFEEMSIKVESFQAKPRLLEVSPETLHAAEIDLQGSVLV